LLQASRGICFVYERERSLSLTTASLASLRLSSPGDPATWLAGADEKPGSWWNDWIAWLKPRAEEQMPARIQRSA
jgi:poly(3-hydroxyalkanoate) synthetase